MAKLMNCFWLAPTLALLLINIVSANIIDKSPNESIESIAEAVCQAGESTISRVSTIGRLVDYFKTPSPMQSYCRDVYYGPLKDLKLVVETSGEDVCSGEKMELIDEFHWKYIVGGLSRKWRKASILSVPEPIRLFFMHYANEIAVKCMKTLPERLKQAVGQNNVQSEVLMSNKFGNTANALTWGLETQNHVMNYDNFFFFWNQVVDKMRKKGHVVGEYIDELSKEQFIGLVKAKDPSKVWATQRQCRLELRPIYQDTVLPVMRLIEIGYGKVDEKSGEIVRGNELIKNWYALTQLCELLIPVNFYQDESLREGQATLVMGGLDAVKGFKREDNIVPLDEIPPNANIIEPVTLDDVLPSAADKKIVKQVSSGMKARSGINRQFIKNTLKHLKSGLSSMLKNLFVLRKTKDNKYVKENSSEIIHNPEAEMSDLLNEDDEESKSLVRNKRRTNIGKLKSKSDKKDDGKTFEMREEEFRKKVIHTVNVCALTIALAIIGGITAIIVIHSG